MSLTDFLAFLDDAERDLATGLRTAAAGQGDESDVRGTCPAPAQRCEERRDALGPARDRHGDAAEVAGHQRVGTGVLSQAAPQALVVAR